LTKEEHEAWLAAKNVYERNRIEEMRDQRRLRERQEQLRQQWDNSEEGRAFQQLAQSFAACRELVAQSPEAASQAEQHGGEKFDVYARLRANLAKANQAPRCCFIKASGELCKAPKMKGQQYCCMHLAMTKAKDPELPPLDDPNAIQVAITQCARGLMDGSLEEKRAMKLAYFLQLAVTNVGRVAFEPDYEIEE
jgi:hypothetical protein